MMYRDDVLLSARWILSSSSSVTVGVHGLFKPSHQGVSERCGGQEIPTGNQQREAPSQTLNSLHGFDLSLCRLLLTRHQSAACDFCICRRFFSLGCDVTTSRPVLRPNWTYWANGPWLSLGLSIVWDKAPLLLYVSRSSPILILPAKRFEPESCDSLDVRLGSFFRLSLCWTSTRLQRSFVFIQKPFIHFGSI